MASRRYINFGVSPEEYQAIKAMADQNGMSAGQFCRVQALAESNLAGIAKAQSDMNARLADLIDRQTMKGVLEYLNTNMPKLVFDYFQSQRAQRGV